MTRGLKWENIVTPPKGLFRLILTTLVDNVEVLGDVWALLAITECVIIGGNVTGRLAITSFLQIG